MALNIYKNLEIDGGANINEENKTIQSVLYIDPDGFDEKVNGKFGGLFNISDIKHREYLFNDL